MKKALFFGALTIDDVRLPDVHLQDVHAGSVAYGGIASGLFAPTIMASVIGSDYSRDMLDKMKERGVIIEHALQSDKQNFRWHARYSHDLSDVQTSKREVNAFKDFDPSAYAGVANDVSVAFLSKNEPQLQLDLIAELPQDTAIILESRGWFVQNDLPVLKKVLKKADMFLVDEHQASLLVGEELPVPEMIDRIMHLGPKTVVFKRGEHGLVLYGRKGLMVVPPYPLAYAVDPTGAGDVLGGTITGVLTRLGSFDEECVKLAVLMGSMVASFVVEDYGPEALMELSVKQIINRTKVFLKQLPTDKDVNFDLLT